MTPNALKKPQAHRYFFALLPDAVTARRIHAFAERTLGEQRLMAIERLHMTLAISEDYDAPQPLLLDALLRAGATVAAAPVELVLDELSISRYTAALRPAHRLKPLHALQAEIDGAVARQGVALREGYHFSPHLTLRYHGGDLVHRPIFGFRWVAGEFVLIESFVGLSHYDVHGRWPLRAPEDPQGSLFPPLI
ncbi:MAG: 2'-5' RNA ligase [Sphingobium sp.]|nr:2'-5' RNA ligase [Sphingobium sp.]